MSSDYDEKVVELRLDNSDFEKNAEESIESMDALKESMNDSDIDMSAVTTALESCSEGFSALDIAATAAIANITTQVVNLGEQLVSSMTVDQVTAGWEKYESKTSSVQTIMNATGKSIDDVNNYLSKLMWFSDETSYSFTDMTDAIGKFTAANIDMDTAVNAVQGISTWAALSGANKTQASRAMYNISQALGVGYMQRIDWASIENAQMATYEFKELVLEAAANLGDSSTLIKQADGTYKTVSEGVTITAENMASKLTETQFLTNDVLMSVLDTYGKFATGLYDYMDAYGFDVASEAIEPYAEYLKAMGEWDDNWELAEKAFKAAQEAKTFTEVIESVKDAASTNWMKIFEHFFGDYEDAKVLWTDLANGLWDIFIGPLDSINSKLDEWESAGGHEKFIDALYNLGDAFSTLLGAFSTAWHTIFPELESSDFETWTDKFLEFSEKVKNAIDYVSGPLEQAAELVEKVTAPFVRKDGVLGSVTGAVEELSGDDTDSATEKVGLWGQAISLFTGGRNGFSDDLEETSEDSDDTSEALEDASDSADTLSGALSYTAKSFEEAGKNARWYHQEAIKPFIDSDLGEETAKVVDSQERLQKVVDALKIIPASLSIVSQALSAFGDVFISPAISTLVTEVLPPVLDFLSNTGNNLTNLALKLEENDTFEKFFINLYDQMASIWSHIGGSSLITSVGGSIEGILDTLESLFGYFVDYDWSVFSDAWKRLSSSFNFAGILNAVDDLITGGAGFSTAFEKIYDFISGIIDLASQIIALIPEGASAILTVVSDTLTSVFDALGEVVHSISASGILELVTNIHSIIMIVELVYWLVETLQSFDAILWSINDVIHNFAIKQLAKAFVFFASGMLILSGAIALLSTIDTAKLVLSAAVITIVMTTMGIIFNSISKQDNFKKASKMMTTFASAVSKFSVGMVIMAAAFKIFSTMSLEGMLIAIVSFAAICVALKVFMKEVSGIKFSAFSSGGIKSMAKSMVIMAAGFVVMAAAFKIFSTMSFEGMLIAIVSFAAICVALKTLMEAVNNSGSKSGSASKLLIVASSLIVLAIGMAAMAGAFKIFSTMSFDGMLIAVVSFAAILVGLRSLMDAANDTDAKTGSIAKLLVVSSALIVLAVGMTAMSVAFKIFSTMSFDGMITALISFMGVILVVELILESISDLGNGLQATTGLLAFSAALIVMSAAFVVIASAMAMISSIGDSGAILSLMVIFTTLAGLLVVLDNFENVSFSSILKFFSTIATLAVGLTLVGAALIVCSAGLTALATAAFLLGGIDLDTVLNGLLILGSAMAATLVLALVIKEVFKILDGVSLKAILKITAGLLGAAAGLTALGVAMKTLSGISFEQMLTGLVLFTGALLVFTLAAGAIQNLGIEKGIEILAAGFVSLALAAVSFAVAINLLSVVGDKIPEVMEQVAQGIVNAMNVFRENISVIRWFLLIVVGIILAVILESRVKIVTTMINVLATVVKAIQTPVVIAMLCSAILMLIASVLEFFGGKVDEIADTLVTTILVIVDAVCKGIIDAIPAIIESVWYAVIGVVGGLIAAIGELLGIDGSNALLDYAMEGLDNVESGLKERLSTDIAGLKEGASSGSGSIIGNLLFGSSDESEVEDACDTLEEEADEYSESSGFLTEAFSTSNEEGAETIEESSDEYSEAIEDSGDSAMDTVTETLENLEGAETLAEGTGTTITSALSSLGVDTTDGINSALSGITDALVTSGVLTEEQASTTLSAIQNALSGDSSSEDYELGSGEVEDGITDSGEGMNTAMDSVTTNVTTAVDAYNQEVGDAIAELASTNQLLEYELSNGEQLVIQADQLGSEVASRSLVNTDENRSMIESYLRTSSQAAGLDIDWSDSGVQAYMNGLESVMANEDNLYEWIQGHDWNYDLNALSGTEGVDYSDAVSIFAEGISNYVARLASGEFDADNLSPSVTSEEMFESNKQQIEGELQDYANAVDNSMSAFGQDVWKTPGYINDGTILIGKNGYGVDASGINTYIEQYNNAADAIENYVDQGNWEGYANSLSSMQDELKTMHEIALGQQGAYAGNDQAQSYWAGVVDKIEAEQAQLEEASAWAEEHKKYVMDFGNEYNALQQAYDTFNKNQTSDNLENYEMIYEGLMSREDQGITDADIAEAEQRQIYVQNWLSSFVSDGILPQEQADVYADSVQTFIDTISDPTTYMTDELSQMIDQWNSFDYTNADSYGSYSFIDNLAYAMLDYDPTAVYDEAKASGETYLQYAKTGFLDVISGNAGWSEDAGLDVDTGLENGMLSGGASLSNVASRVGTEFLINPLLDSVGTHSPSTITTEAGQDIDQGLVNGMELGKTDVYNEGQVVGEAAIHGVQEAVDSGTPITISYEIQNGTPEGAGAESAVDTEGFAEAGSANVEAEASGVSKSSWKVQSAAASASTSAAASVRRTYSSFYTAGSYLIDGLVKGIQSGKTKVTTVIEEMANAALAELESDWDEHSPSRVTYQMGEYFVQGLANGITDSNYIVANSSESMASTALDSALGYLDNVSTGEYQIATGIKPVIDTRVASATAAEMNGMFRNRTVNLDTSLTKTATQASAYADFMTKAGEHNNSDVISTITGLKSNIDELQTAIMNMNLYINGKTLVGSIVKDMDGALGARALAKSR